MPVRPISRIAAIAYLLVLIGCHTAEGAYEPAFVEGETAERVYSFAVHPLHNPALLHKTYGPLIEYLNANGGGAKFKLIASRDYAAFGRRMAAQEFAFALPNPYQAVQSTSSGYRIFGKMSGDDNFRGIILTRRGAGPATLEGLRGKTISYPAPTAVAATMLPQYYLHAHGVPLSATRTVYVGSMESAIESVATGSSDAAAIWPDPWEKFVRQRPDVARKLEIRWTTPSLVNNALVVHHSVPPAVSQRVLRALEELSASAEGRRLLRRIAVRGFEKADQQTYEPVRRFLVDFSRNVRPLPGFGAARL